MLCSLDAEFEIENILAESAASHTLLDVLIRSYLVARREDELSNFRK